MCLNTFADYPPEPDPAIAVISPNGGENLSSGAAHEITWSSEGDIENVNIEYSVNNGTHWIEIVVIEAFKSDQIRKAILN